MKSTEPDFLVLKVEKGIRLAVSRLIEKTSIEDGELVFSKNGKIVRVKARDLKLDSK